MKISFLPLVSVLLAASSALADDGPVAGKRFLTKNAIVVSRPANKGQKPEFSVATDLQPIDVTVTTDKKDYVEGDELVVTIRAAESGHLRLLYQNANGEIYTLYPNQFITSDRIEGGHSVKVMPAPNPNREGEVVAIQIAGPHFGKESLAAIVSSQPFADEASLKEKLKSAIFAKSGEPTLVAAITKDARVVSRPERADGAAAQGAGFAIVTLATARK